MTHNGISLPEISNVLPVNLPESRLLLSACNEFLRKRGMAVRHRPLNFRKPTKNPKAGS
jgi:hypothetical protein